MRLKDAFPQGEIENLGSCATNEVSKVSADILVLGLSNVNFSDLITQQQQHRLKLDVHLHSLSSVRCHIHNGTDFNVWLTSTLHPHQYTSSHCNSVRSSSKRMLSGISNAPRGGRHQKHQNHDDRFSGTFLFLASEYAICIFLFPLPNNNPNMAVIRSCSNGKFRYGLLHNFDVLMAEKHVC